MMSSHAQKLSLMVITQIETVNNIVHTDEIPSLQLLCQGHYIAITDEQKNYIAEMVGDCPLALELLLHIIDKYQSREGMENPIDRLMERLNKSINEERIDEELVLDIMQIAYDHLDSSAQCCGVVSASTQGSFSENLLTLTEDILVIFRAIVLFLKIVLEN